MASERRKRPRRAAPLPPPGGYSGTPLAKKLGIGSGARLFVQAAPDHYAQLLAPLPAGVQTVPRFDARTDVAHVFATRRAVLGQLLPHIRGRMRDDALVWVSWPKKAAGVPTDITEDVVRELALPLGLVDVKVCAVDATWSGLKLVLRLTERAAAVRQPRPRAAQGRRSP